MLEHLFNYKIAVAFSGSLGIVTTLIVLAVVAIVTSVVFSVIQAFQSPKPAKVTFGYSGDVGGSPRYGQFGPLDNTVSNEIAVPILYGKLKLAGNVIWQTDPGETVARIVGVCEGQINSITDVRANDVPVNDSDTPGSSVTIYLGTTTQESDSRLPDSYRPDMNLRNLAYLALTLKSSDKLKGGNPTITSIVEGMLVEIWNGVAWPTSKVFSRNPAACIRDFIINTRYGLGVSKNNLDEASFGAVYEYCEGIVGYGGNEPPQATTNTVLLLHFDCL